MGTLPITSAVVPSLEEIHGNAPGIRVPRASHPDDPDLRIDDDAFPPDEPPDDPCPLGWREAACECGAAMYVVDGDKAICRTCKEAALDPALVRTWEDDALIAGVWLADRRDLTMPFRDERHRLEWLSAATEEILERCKRGPVLIEGKQQMLRLYNHVQRERRIAEHAERIGKGE